MKTNLLSFFILVLFAASCGQQRSSENSEQRLGVVDLEVTGSEEALPSFERGLLLLHSFEYADAREAFREAKERDPNMAMAYWGEALTHNHSLWRNQKYNEAREVVDSLDALDVELKPIENDLIETLHVLYEPDTEKAARDIAYRDALASLHEKYPNSEDVGSLYALSILGAVQEGRDYEAYARAAEIAGEVIEKNPEHPGALHYYIHACDDPKNAEKALDEAYAYAKVAPDAAHALHMPSHIFSAMGLWDDLIASNIDAFKASAERRKRKELPHSKLDYHSFHWLEYGYLQKGQIDSAEAVFGRMNRYAEMDSSKRSRYHLIFQQSTFLAETGDYTHPIGDVKVQADDLAVTVRAQQKVVEGMRAYQNADTAKLKSTFTAIEDIARREALFLDTADFKICIDLNREMPRQIDIDLSMVMALQLEAMYAQSLGNKERAESLLKSAVEKELEQAYSFGPPIVRKPSTELYADWLLEQGRAEEAASYYAKTLERAPGRRLAMEGEKRAKESARLAAR
ncbi:MAG: hypothetical protein ABR574_09415 [Cryomorphaceae bacterium]